MKPIIAAALAAAFACAPVSLAFAEDAHGMPDARFGQPVGFHAMPAQPSDAHGEFDGRTAFSSGDRNENKNMFRGILGRMETNSFQNVLASVQNLLTKVESRVASSTATSTNASSTASLLATAQAEVAAAASAVSSLESLVNLATSTVATSTASTTPQAAFSAVKSAMDAARTALNNARDALVAVIRSLQSPDIGHGHDGIGDRQHGDASSTATTTPWGDRFEHGTSTATSTWATSTEADATSTASSSAPVHRGFDFFGWFGRFFGFRH